MVSIVVPVACRATQQYLSIKGGTRIDKGRGSL